MTTTSIPPDTLLGTLSEVDLPCTPDQTDVDTVRELLDLMGDFHGNQYTGGVDQKIHTTDQRARYQLSSDWLRDRGAQAAARVRAVA